MTINVNVEAVATSIAGLSISGVTMRDINQIPMDAEMAGPTFYPRPQDFITDVAFTRMSTGGHGSMKLDMGYTLHYMYLHAPVGGGVATLAVYQGLIQNIATILEVLLTNDDISGAVDMTVESISNVGPVGDPSGNAYHGVEIALRILEHAQ